MLDLCEMVPWCLKLAPDHLEELKPEEDSSGTVNATGEHDNDVNA